jgi:hypothetical protein
MPVSAATAGPASAVATAGPMPGGAPATRAAAVTIASSPSSRQSLMAAPFAATVASAAAHAVPLPSMTRAAAVSAPRSAAACAR